jgi:hypothetical protein
MNPDNACPGRDASPGDPHIFQNGVCVFCLEVKRDGNGALGEEQAS